MYADSDESSSFMTNLQVSEQLSFIRTMQWNYDGAWAALLHIKMPSA